MSSPGGTRVLKQPGGASGAPSLPPAPALPGLAQFAQSELAAPLAAGHCRPPVAPWEIAGSSSPAPVLEQPLPEPPSAGIDLPGEQEEQTAAPREGRAGVTLGSEQPPPKTQAKGPEVLRAGARSWPRQLWVPFPVGLPRFGNLGRKSRKHGHVPCPGPKHGTVRSWLPCMGQQRCQ